MDRRGKERPSVPGEGPSGSERGLKSFERPWRRRDGRSGRSLQRWNPASMNRRRYQSILNQLEEEKGD